MTDGRWTAVRQVIRVEPIPIPPFPFEEARIQTERISMQDIDEIEASVGCQVATQSKTTTGRKPVQIVAEYQLKNVSELLHKEQKYWIEEAVAEEKKEE